MKRYNRASALLTALLIVAMIVLFVSYISSKQRYKIATLSISIRSEQAMQYALGVETWAARTLATVEDVETLQLPVVFSIPVSDTAQVKGQILDAQYQFNLNNLTDKKFEPGFLNLLAGALPEQSEEQLVTLMNQIQVYLGQDKAVNLPDMSYRMGQQLMRHRSELRLIPAVTPDIYARLSPHVTALPDKVLLNPSFAQPLALMALDETMSREAAVQLHQNAPFQSAEALSGVLAELDLGPLQGDTLQSNYFLVRADVSVDDLHLVVYSLLYKIPDTNAVSVVWRSRGIA